MDASASLVVYELDDAGNWPMELEVDGLPPLANDHVYELWLTRDGRARDLRQLPHRCDGTASVPMNAPWPLDEFDGWVIVEEGSKKPMLST